LPLCHHAATVDLGNIDAIDVHVHAWAPGAAEEYPMPMSVSISGGLLHKQAPVPCIA
jgi:hypothetical protein